MPLSGKEMSFTQAHFVLRHTTCLALSQTFHAFQVCFPVEGTHHPPLHPEQPSLAGEEPGKVREEAGQVRLRGLH